MGHKYFRLGLDTGRYPALKIYATSAQATRWNKGRFLLSDTASMLVLNIDDESGSYPCFASALLTLRKKIGSDMVWNLYLSHKLVEIDEADAEV